MGKDFQIQVDENWSASAEVVRKPGSQWHVAIQLIHRETGCCRAWTVPLMDTDVIAGPSLKGS
jgi:hypothetical protein